MNRTPSTTHPTAKAPFPAVAGASRVARRDAGIAAPELARRVKAELPSVPLAACRRAADLVLDGRGGRGRRTTKHVLPLADRLRNHKIAKVVRSFERTGFRHSRAWEGNLLVHFGTPAATQRTDEGWIDYKRDGWRRGIVGETVEVTVPPDWGSRVRPLDDTAGLFLLDAERLPTDGQVEVYRSAWCRQGRGVSLVVERGFVARHAPTGLAYHSTNPDPAAAVRGLRRQVEAQGVPVEVREGRRAALAEARRVRKAEALTRLYGQLERHDLGAVAHVVVRLDDSYRAGNCAPGTLSFRDRFLPGRDSATVGEIAAAVGHGAPSLLSRVDLTLARQLAAACLQAIRRDRSRDRNRKGTVNA